MRNFSSAAILAIALICHETNRAYCSTLGDNSQLPWSEAPQWQKDSAIKGVEFNLENPDAPASASHDSWLAVKEADGWKYGATKNPEKKEHPCFVPYDQLPEDQKRKDLLFKTVVCTFAKHGSELPENIKSSVELTRVGDLIDYGMSIAKPGDEYFGIGLLSGEGEDMIRCAARLPLSPSPEDIEEALGVVIERIKFPSHETCAYDDEALLRTPKEYTVASLR